MRSILAAFLLLFVSTFAFGQQAGEWHQATPWRELLEKHPEWAQQAAALHHHDHDGMSMDAASGSAVDASPVSVTATQPVRPLAVSNVAVQPNATKTFTVKAHRFSFDVTPAFIVNVGDDVTLNITSTDTTHGFALEKFHETFETLVPGREVTVHFVANQAGEFTYFCTINCGEGHLDMDGVMTVMAVTNPAPSIASIDPASGPIAGGTQVTITGNNFVSGATVTFGSAGATNVTVDNATTIHATAPAQAAGSATVTVRNPDGQTATTTFTYVAPPAFAIDSVTPSTGPTTGGTPITITGNGFVAGATVTIGGVAARNVTVVNANTITALTPRGPANEQATLPKDVVVTNPDGQSVTKSGAFTYTVPAPAIAAVSPTSGLPAGGGSVEIRGAGFTTAVPITVTFGGVAATNVTVLDATSIRVTAPAHAAGAVDVALTVGAQSTSATNAFTYYAPPPRRRAAGH